MTISSVPDLVVTSLDVAIVTASRIRLLHQSDHMMSTKLSMALEDPVTMNVEEASRAPPTPPSHTQASDGGESILPCNTTPLTSRQQVHLDQDAPHDIASADTGLSMAVPVLGVPMFPFPPGTRPRRIQCKNACTNCQKACKRCDDNRPCLRCIRYETMDTCVDSKRKERKKGLKRGPYKKRDSKGHPAPDRNDVENHSVPGHYLHMPYVGPTHFPPNMWNAHTETGLGNQTESGGYYYSMFTFAPVAGLAWPNTGNVTDGGGTVPAPHYPIGFYPANFIPYPGSYPQYTIPPSGPGGSPYGFHYAYPPSGPGGPPQGSRYTYPPLLFPGVFPRAFPNMITNPGGDSQLGINAQGSATTQNADDNSGNSGHVEKRNTHMDRQDMEDRSEGNGDADDDEISSVLE